MLPLHNQRTLYMAIVGTKSTAFLRHGISTSSRCSKWNPRACLFHHSTSCEIDQRQRLSRIWVPSGGIARRVDEDAHSKLVRAGFLRQAHSGIFHMLPLGRRVQEKIERLIDKHMSSLNASRLDLSSISSEDLWRRSGRFKKVNPELFAFKDRKDVSYLLSPTHEEEITGLVAGIIKSYKQMPTRLYQISRKYRDELRPRHGLLRSREFIMKDLYTFDYSEGLALATYEQVRKAYASLFNELKIPYIVAEADSGDMGGNLSHEYHFLTSKGEDHVINCQSCDYVANEELAKAAAPASGETHGGQWTFVAEHAPIPSSNSPVDRLFSVWRGLSRDRSTLINVWYALSHDPSSRASVTYSRPRINIHAIKRTVPDLDFSVGNTATLWAPNTRLAPKFKSNPTSVLPKIVNLVDCRLPTAIVREGLNSKLPIWPESVDRTAVTEVTSSIIFEDPLSNERLDLLQIQPGDICSKCGEGRLNVSVAIELGHTFFLGTRYTEPFDAFVTLPSGNQSLMQMGCHGIGVSRMIGAVAETLADENGLNWPRVIAPYEVVVVPTLECESDIEFIYDGLVSEPGNPSRNPLDVILDDRAHPFPWKMRDADLIGYPIIVVVGNGWKNDRTCEVQCRRLGVRENVHFEQLYTFVQELFVRL